MSIWYLNIQLLIKWLNCRRLNFSTFTPLATLQTHRKSLKWIIDHILLLKGMKQIVFILFNLFAFRFRWFLILTSRIWRKSRKPMGYKAPRRETRWTRWWKIRFDTVSLIKKREWNLGKYNFLKIFFCSFVFAFFILLQSCYCSNKKQNKKRSTNRN